MDLSISEKLQILARRKGVSVADLAAGLGCSVQNVYKKLHRDKWTLAELETYAARLGCSVAVIFTDTDTGETL